MDKELVEKCRLTPEEIQELEATIVGGWHCQICSKTIAKAQLTKAIPIIFKFGIREVTSRLNKRDVGGINPEWALSDRDYQELEEWGIK